MTRLEVEAAAKVAACGVAEKEVQETARAWRAMARAASPGRLLLGPMHEEAKLELGEDIFELIRRPKNKEEAEAANEKVEQLAE